MFTSIGKKVITTTTAALDCQSKPNHITMIGAMPMIGRAATKLPSGSSPRRRNGTRSARIATRKPAAQPMAQPVSTARRKVWTKSAHKVGGRGGEARRRSPTGWASARPARRSRRWRPPTGTGRRRRKRPATARSSRRWRSGSSSSTAASASTASQAASHRLSTRSQKPGPAAPAMPGRCTSVRATTQPSDDQAPRSAGCGAGARRPTAPMARKAGSQDHRRQGKLACGAVDAGRLVEQRG